MLPTFEVMGDWVVISRKFRRGRGVEIGDVVQFDSVVEPGEGVIKRVLALEGDYVLRDTPGTASDEMLQVGFNPCLNLAKLIKIDSSRSLLGSWG